MKMELEQIKVQTIRFDDLDYGNVGLSARNTFKLASIMRLIPTWDDKVLIEINLRNLERTCRTAGSPKSQWINILRPQLKGKAQFVFAKVSEDVASDYDRFK